MKTRIAQIISYKNISAAKFADLLGVQRSSISHILNGRNNPSLEIVQKIIHHFPEINLEWLISGKGIMLKQPQQGELFLKEEANIAQTDTEEPINNVNYNMFTNVNNEARVKKIIIVYTDKSFEVLDKLKN